MYIENKKVSKHIVYLLYFFFIIYYNYYGEDMKDNIIVKIDNMGSIDNITSDTRYINIDMSKCNDKVIDYFINNGSDYLYADTINNINGFIYAPYDVFMSSEKIIKNVLNDKIKKFNKMELVRYLYISLGRIVNTSIEDNYLSDINNIWTALDKKTVNNASVCKIFSYLLKRVNIKSELINNDIKGNMAIKVKVDGKTLILDLYNDIYNIQGGFKTKFFDKYNDDKVMDKKVSYISDEYMDYYLDEMLSDINENNVLEDILYRTQDMFDFNSIGTYELSKIYSDIFNKYARGYDIRISNLFVYDKKMGREHFLVFSLDDKLYSYNYNKGCFISVNSDILLSNFYDNKIGFYSEEDYIFGEKGMVM